ncbi:MAG: metalloregulator ArsR/SmtB family transcription factor [Stappiaceae bacterium]
MNRVVISDCADVGSTKVPDSIVALRFKALGHPVRLEILKKLASCDSACCGDLVGCMLLAQSTVSQHLQVLKEAGLIDCHADGRRSSYRLNKANFEAMRNSTMALFETYIFTESGKCCEGGEDYEAAPLRKKED